MSGSSSEEDEIVRKRIKEVASEELIRHMKDREKNSSVSPAAKLNDKRKRRSLRDNFARNDDAQYEIVSTPEFKVHIAKKLSSYLDKMYDTSSSSRILPNDCDATKRHGGVRLLSSSRSHMTGVRCEGSENKPGRRQRLPSSDSSSDEEEMQRLASVCVTGNSILSHGEGAFKKEPETGTPPAKAGENGTLHRKSDYVDELKAPQKKKRKKHKDDG